MTSKSESQETSEFLRRRQLRLQQVREQSKDIAKKIRQRAKVEKLRQVVELDERKERDYKQNQEKVVKKLEELYSRGLSNVGSSHQQARGLTQSENLAEKVDLSHLRGREAAAEVKRQKQQKLDELKKALDRKLQAREAANELSREKSASAASKLSKLSSKINIVNEDAITTTENANEDLNSNNKDLPKEVARTDMGTQWDIDLLSPEWEPNVPALALPQEDDIKESAGDKDNAANKQRNSDLFAISDEMPLSLRGGIAKPCDTGPTKLSSTLVSEYIQNRVLRLRESESNINKPQSDDLKNLRQTITRSRPLRREGSAISNICHVVEGQAYPVPMWHPETSCQCKPVVRITHNKQALSRNHFPINVYHSNRIISSIAPVKQNSVPSPVSRKARPLLTPHKCCEYNELAGHANGLLRSKDSDNMLSKKKSVTTYNHSTRDSRDVPRVDERLVYRDRSLEQDAYSQALSESMSACNQDKQKKRQDTASKIAVTRQNVDKEYKDTIAFLNSLPKNKNTRPINNAFKDDHRLQEQKDSRQRILQQEFRNIEKENRRQDSQGCRLKSRLISKSPSKRSKSPADSKVDNNWNERDFQYSWMPVPESDSKLAVHTIPAEERAGPASHPHSVKFGVDSYHEYRSRHKHTPPTKDTAGLPGQADRNAVRTVIFQKNDDSLSDESPASDNSSTDGRESDPKQNDNIDDSLKRRELTDTERIIIYKILNYKHRKKNISTKVNSSDDVAKGNGRSKDTQDENITEPSSSEKAVCQDVERDEHVREDRNLIGTDHIAEGVYEVAGKNKDNLESMYYSRLDNNQSSSSDNKCDKRKKVPCSRRCDAGDSLHHSRKKCSSAKCKGHSPKSQQTVESSQSGPAAPAADTAAAAPASAQDAGFVKLVDDDQKQQGNFYIGATGILKNDAYEVIIQLRKNDTTKEVPKMQDVPIEVITADTRNENATITKLEISSSFGAPSLEHKDDVQQKTLSNDNNLVATAPPPPVTDQDCGVNGTENKGKQSLSEANRDDVQPIKTTQDKSVSTSFNAPTLESFAKSEPVARPAMSTCTQTTASPSNPRPVYIHMSSSTSTAYMSPPEVVLPHFFKRGDKPCRKTRRTAENIEKQEKRNVIRHEHHCKRYSTCKIFEKLLTKPKIDRHNFCADMYSNKNVYPPFSYAGNKFSECNTSGASELCCKHHTRKIKHHLKSAKKTNTKNAIMQSKRNRTSKYASKLSSKSYISPMIRQYIHKLLSLNREGLKAIQIMNQDCSSVNTPASSIINVPTNFSNNNSQRRHLVLGNRDWEELGSVLSQGVFLHTNATDAMFNRSDNATKRRNRKANNIKPPRNTKNKRMHKIKSLNISKNIIVKTREASTKTKVDNCSKKLLSNVASEQDPVCPPPPADHIKNYRKSSGKNKINSRTTSTDTNKRQINQYDDDDFPSEQPKAASSNSNSNDEIQSKPINISTQTSCSVDGEINFIKLAEGKLENMEKIADLTEKCTKRLSNLAKVLEEVRKNKSLAYSQVSTADSTSDSDQKSDKMVCAENVDLKIPLNIRDDNEKSNNQYNIVSTEYESLTSGVPNNGSIEFPQDQHSNLYETSNSEYISQSSSSVSTNGNCRGTNNTKCRNRPPPALLRMNLKRPQDHIVPHELSTVMEVDSPLSVKFKQHDSPINTNQSTISHADPNKDEEGTVQHQSHPETKVLNIVNKSSNENNKVISDSPEDSKLQMMDLNQFNEIMLKPFVSLQEYAREHYEISTHTKRENFSNVLGINDDISSLHSDSSLPDVVAELLKRKLITEPFRFDTASNMNSTTLSSESTLSVLALSKDRKDKTKSRFTANKENVGETSDSLSISSNPDLENAFKKLGMGWASSTLKRTKERLALSSSSNTSSASFSQVKFKNSAIQDEQGADAIWSVSNISKKPALKRRLDTSKNAEQQTSFTNNMTVKEFLTKELAKKITFTDKFNRNDSNQEFVSLFETKLPEDFKNTSKTMMDDNSGESVPSGNNNRARTSTPVKLFKSVTYHSSSSSNMSNGLFSNADELSSVKLTSASARHQSVSDKDELTIPNCSLKMRKTLSDCSKTDSC
ncbi:uncharacterized protein LOC134678602 isoform X2 [Cydia fagiglandana]|uniref:uncharacterized protein LOC134678602 isoform X2 n=1 Tax=Cydia fagiglandana TaxID=1458189 RepID=UPI002FEE506A